MGCEQMWLPQGLEKPVIILSTAVTRPGSFVGDAQRLNVALTRAKHHLILVSALHLMASAFTSISAAALLHIKSPAHGQRPPKDTACGSADPLA